MALQKVKPDLQSSMNLIKSIQRFLEKMKFNENIHNIITYVKDFAGKIGVAAELEKETHVCLRKTKRQFLL